MAEAYSQVFAEDVVYYAMRQRGKNWKRAFLNITDDDPNFRRIFTPEIGKAVLQCANQESWNYMDVVHFLVQELLPNKRHCYGKFNYCLTNVGKEFLDWDRKDTLFSYCGMIAEVCFYCLERGHSDLIEAAILAAVAAINEKLRFTTDTDLERYHRYAMEYNKIYAETFLPDEQNLGLNFISSSNKLSAQSEASTSMDTGS